MWIWKNDVDETMKTMVPEPYVHLVFVLTGGIDYDEVCNFYKNYFLFDKLLGLYKLIYYLFVWPFYDYTLCSNLIIPKLYVIFLFQVSFIYQICNSYLYIKITYVFYMYYRYWARP